MRLTVHTFDEFVRFFFGGGADVFTRDDVDEELEVLSEPTTVAPGGA
jgi:hypothetical protein